MKKERMSGTNIIDTQERKRRIRYTGKKECSSVRKRNKEERDIAQGEER